LQLEGIAEGKAIVEIVVGNQEEGIEDDEIDGVGVVSMRMKNILYVVLCFYCVGMTK